MAVLRQTRTTIPAAAGQHRARLTWPRLTWPRLAWPRLAWPRLAWHGAPALAWSWRTLVLWRQRAVGRQALRDADPHIWKDLGQARVSEEIRKPFWRG